MSSAPTPPAPSPSASVMLISATNQVLLLRRVRTTSAFPSASVFPGGNLSSFHEVVPQGEHRHADGLAYRLAAVRETFEESGILLARRQAQVGRGGGEVSVPAGSEVPLLHLPDDEAEAARKAIHGDKVRFTDWLESVGGVADIGGLIPFTRWITPIGGAPKRFSVQMYVYFLPLNSPRTVTSRETSPVPGDMAAGASRTRSAHTLHTPTHDGGLEHTSAAFDDPANWLAAAQREEVMLYEPQAFLLAMLAQYLGPRGGASVGDSNTQSASRRDYAAERAALVSFITTTPTVGPPGAPSSPRHPTADIPWGEKCIYPRPLPIVRPDGRQTLALEDPGPELAGSSRGGDWDRVVVGNWRDMRVPMVVKWRRDVVGEGADAEGGQGAKL